MPSGSHGLVLGAAGEQDAVRTAGGGREGQQGEDGMVLAAVALLQIQLQRGEGSGQCLTQLLRGEEMLQQRDTVRGDLATQLRAQLF